MLALACACVAAYSHGVFSYADARDMLPKWVTAASLIRSIHRVGQERRVLADAAAGIDEAPGFAVVQEDGGGCNLFLISEDEEERVATVRACVWYHESSDRHVALGRLRDWHRAAAADGWSLRFGAMHADALEWVWGEEA